MNRQSAQHTHTQKKKVLKKKSSPWYRVKLLKTWNKKQGKKKN